jgi:hypothetical protein
LAAINKQIAKIMSDNSNAGCLGILMIIIPIAGWLGTGYLAWNWVEPESFWGAIKFIIAWGIFGYIAQLIAMAIIALVAKTFDN